jgi:hypothetical protein
MTKVLLKPDAHGNLIVPREVLGEGAKDTVYSVEREGKAIRLEPAQQRLREIENPVERAAAAERFFKRIAHKTGVRWPEDYDVRNDIYD